MTTTTLPPIGIVREGVAVNIWLEAYEEDGRLICGVYQLTGRIKLGPKAWLKAVRQEIAKLERIAKNSGCVEMRVAGRDWSRVLEGYEPFDGPENGLRKVLT